MKVTVEPTIIVAIVIATSASMMMKVSLTRRDKLIKK